MATIKYWNGTAWELAIVGKQGPAGPTGPTGATGPDSVTTKGDLATYSTTPTRLPVGSNGDTLVADSAATTGLRWQGDYAAGKNKIINGDFNINQRGFSSTTTTGTFMFDRFAASCTGGTSTYTAQTFTPGTAPVAGYEAKNYIDVASTGQSAAGDFTRLLQNIESVRTLANQSVTISFWAKANSGTPKVAVEVQQVFGTGGSPSSTVNTYFGQATLSTAWARYSVTTTLPSISGKTLGTANDDRLSVNFYTSAGTTFDARTGSLGVQTTTISFWGWQFEAGSVATAFQTATGTLQGELALCQRYYYRLTPGATGVVMAFGGAHTTSAARVTVFFPVEMRVRPTALETNGTANNYSVGMAGILAYTMDQVPVFTNSNTISGIINCAFTGSSPLVQFNPATLQTDSTNGATAFIGWSAEL